ncbi:LacI family transcriptional regulator [Glycomyces sp. TRM65418]|uniref:LacI family DNA-binding transcriptional regulator n=1 Tax=Glycomyces sp. TRM65418 TaxID=2867006 RepID=UPI001CE51006|nr:LacI family DNA-binding transcriptional regulator [Glycomyces sp. TRM65418]MCC3763154.1 LacI family transcriptional regulator [Glycomyces sp. TRM65418]QZD57160.1 LacI family transcriptional regulator [Glycomyces sp. TRM65418]
MRRAVAGQGTARSPRQGRPTLEEVAERAGVSRATVSRVVNGQTTVAEDLRRAVEAAAAELGYVPHAAARSLVTHRTDSVALILPESPNRVFSDDQFFPSVIRGVAGELDAAGKLLVLLTTGSAEARSRAERYAVGGHVDGVMFASLHDADLLPELMLRRGVPVVCNGLPHLSAPCIDVDHESGVEAAVRYLLAQGRRRIATVAGPQDMVAGRTRLDAYRQTLAEADRRAIIAVGDFTAESGHAGMRQLLADEPEIDAVFVASDLMAHGALQALREAGRRVPEDVAVVGFDDIALASYCDPPLTTVRQPIAEIGRSMARTMLRLLDGLEVEPLTILPTELVVRESA